MAYLRGSTTMPVSSPHNVTHRHIIFSTPRHVQRVCGANSDFKATLSNLTTSFISTCFIFNISLRPNSCGSSGIISYSCLLKISFNTQIDTDDCSLILLSSHTHAINCPFVFLRATKVNSSPHPQSQTLRSRIEG